MKKQKKKSITYHALAVIELWSGKDFFSIKAEDELASELKLTGHDMRTFVMSLRAYVMEATGEQETLLIKEVTASKNVGGLVGVLIKKILGSEISNAHDLITEVQNEN